MTHGNGSRDHTDPHRYDHDDRYGPLAAELAVPIDDADPWNDLWLYCTVRWVLPHR